MKRDLLNRTLFVLIAFFACSLTTQAQLLMEENFEYEAGGLYNQGGWMKYYTNAADPIQVIDQSLTYPDYANVSKAVELKTTATAEDLYKVFTTEDVTNGTIYCSALVNFKEVNAAAGKDTYFLCLFPQPKAGYLDTKSGTEIGRVFAKKGSTDNKFCLGVSRGSAKANYTQEEYDLGTTYLIVLKYEIIEGNTNDIVTLFVNPAITAQEPAISTESLNIATDQNGSDASVSYGGIKAIELRQSQSGTKDAPNVLIGGLRVARTYAELFKLTPPTPEPEPEITYSPTSFYFGGGSVYAGETYTQNITIKGKNLKGDITVGGLTSGEITASATTIPQADAESEAGYTLTLTFQPADPEKFMETIIFSSEGMKDVNITTYWETTVIEDVANLTELWQKDFSAFGKYRITGEVTISHKQILNGQTYYYFQDDNKGMYLLDALEDITDVNLKAGTKIKNLIGQTENSFGGYLIPVSGIKLYDIVSQDNTIAPKLVTLSELETNAAQYKDMLVKVNNVELGWMKESNFEPVAPGDVFTDDAANRTYIKDADGKTVSIRIFPETDIIGAPTPATAHITGLSTSAAGNLIAPRSLADIEKLTDPVSIKDNKDQSLSVFTAKGTIRIDGAGVRKVELYDITGNKVAETATQELNGLVPALYLVKVTTTEGTVVKKIYIK